MSFTEPWAQLLAAPCLPVVYQQHCHRQAADLWLFISSRHHLHPHPSTDGLWLFTQGEKRPKPAEYNKQEVIIWKLIVITIYWSLKKWRLIRPALIIRCYLIICSRLIWLPQVSPLILITLSASACVDSPSHREMIWRYPYVFESNYSARFTWFDLRVFTV